MSTRPGRAAGSAAATDFAGGRGGVWTGSSMTNVVPRPGSLSTSIVPWWSVTMSRHSERPSPVPSPTGLVVKNGSKIFARTSAGMPGPVSPISRRTRRRSAS